MSIERGKCGCLIIEVTSAAMLEHASYMPMCAADALAKLATALSHARTISFQAPDDMAPDHYFTLELTAKDGTIYRAMDIPFQAVPK